MNITKLLLMALLCAISFFAGAQVPGSIRGIIKDAKDTPACSLRKQKYTSTWNGSTTRVGENQGVCNDRCADCCAR